MNLTLKIIEKYNLPKVNYKPDYDDAGYKFTLPSGIELSTLFMCNGESTECDSLEGLDGYIYIETEEELVKLISMDYNEILNKIWSESEDFDINYYLDL